ncbi:MAG: hypothetical protein ACT4PJ_04955 [Gemmatimonadaceae bacterium]
MNRHGLMRSLLSASLILGAHGVAPAQNLGPFRQLLSLEPYYAYVQFDVDGDADAVSRHGYGGRLSLNLAPFGLGRATGLSLFVTHTMERDEDEFTTLHYGAAIEIFPFHVPLGGFLDPVISVAGGAFRTEIGTTSDTEFALTPAFGLRIPIPNRLQLRGDIGDAIIFGRRTGVGDEKRTIHNLQVTAALGLTF